MMRACRVVVLVFIGGCSGQRLAANPRSLQPISNDESETSAVDVAPPTFADALEGSPLSMDLRYVHSEGCSQTTVTTSYEGSFVLRFDDDRGGEAQLTIEHRDVSISLVDGGGTERHVSHKRFNWSFEMWTEGHALMLELIPARGCELVNDTSSDTLLGCPDETPPFTFVCIALRVGDLDLHSADPAEGHSNDSVVLLCRSSDRDRAENIGSLLFMGEPFVLAPSPGVMITHIDDENTIQGELLRPEE